MDINVQIISAFIDDGAGGNLAGVVLDADHLTTAEKQAIAAAVGVSETAFVSESATADFKLDFFTPNRQIAHCGHATIATFSYLAQSGRLTKSQSSKETIDGDRDIFIDGDLAFMAQTAPVYTELAGGEIDRILSSLRLSSHELLTGFSPMLVNTGNTFLLLPLKSLAALRAVAPDFAQVEEISDQYDLIGYHLFTRETAKPNRVASARMFAPRYGINEESATGTASGTQACYLYDVLGIKQTEMVLEQGVCMQPAAPSKLLAQIQLDNGVIAQVLIGGEGKRMVERTVSI